MNLVAAAAAASEVAALSWNLATARSEQEHLFLVY
jgi:hypothetical protein